MTPPHVVDTPGGVPVQQLDQAFRASAIVSLKRVGAGTHDTVAGHLQMAGQRGGQDRVIQDKVIDRFLNRRLEGGKDPMGRIVVDDAGQPAESRAIHLLERKDHLRIVHQDVAGKTLGGREVAQRDRHGNTDER